jgi:hypothetical protein
METKNTQPTPEPARAFVPEGTEKLQAAMQKNGIKGVSPAQLAAAINDFVSAPKVAR